MFCSMKDEPKDDGQFHTLGLLEQLRTECKALWGASSDAYYRVGSTATAPLHCGAALLISEPNRSQKLEAKS
jgi:hypothetical protein